jgi:rubrerythrin
MASGEGRFASLNPETLLLQEPHMPLQNFGSIFNFAEELERQDQQYYATVADNPACAAYIRLFSELEADAARHIKEVQRIRRENVTEMILESVADFTRGSFCEACDPAAEMNAAEALETATRLEARAERYYTEAAEKIKTLTEASRALKTIAKNRKAHIVKLMNAKR